MFKLEQEQLPEDNFVQFGLQVVHVLRLVQEAQP
jgi:hypothetical protein